MNPKLMIYYIKLNEDNPFESFLFLNKKYIIDKSSKYISIDIDKNLLTERKEKKIFKIEFIRKTKTKELNISDNIIYRFNLYFGVNKAYLFLSNQKEQLLFELYFREKEVSVIYENLELTNTDYFDDDSRRRMVIINSPYLIKIKGSYNFIYEYISTNLRKEKENSYSISVFDIEKSFCSAKIIKDENNASYSSLLKGYKTSLENFKNDINNLLFEADDDKKYKDIIQRNFICILDINFSKDISNLKDDIKSDNEYYLMYLYYFWYILYICYCKNNNYEIPIKTMVEYLNKFYYTYLEDKDLLPYQKVLLFYSNSVYFVKIQNTKIYESKELKLIKFKNSKEKSVYGLSLKFIKEFIHKLKSNSALFYPLLLLNSGEYYYQNELTYGFDAQNCDNIKYHLNDLIPEVFFEIKDGFSEISNNDYGFNYKGLGIVFLNRDALLRNYNYNPELFEYNNFDNEKKVKSYAVKVSMTIIYECFRQNKYIYNSSKIIDLSLRFFSNEKNLVTNISPPSYSYDNNFIMTSSHPNNGESGKFLEFLFGQYEHKMIISLIFEIDDISKLYDSIDYFVKDDLSDIRKYIAMKYELKKRGYNYQENNDYNLKEENKNLEIVFNNKYKDDLFILKNEIFDRSKSNDDLSEFIFSSKSQIKGYNYYMKKANDESDLTKKAEYLWELLNNLKSC